MNELLKLAEQCEKAEGPDRELDLLLAEAAGWSGVVFSNLRGDAYGTDPTGTLNHTVPRYTASLDAAMTLVPESGTNVSLFSHSSGWSCSFHDTAQVMGERAAKEKIARLKKTEPLFNELRGEPLVKYEKAIAEHWLEFMATAKTPALALCAAALRSKAKDHSGGGE